MDRLQMIQNQHCSNDNCICATMDHVSARLSRPWGLDVATLKSTSNSPTNERTWHDLVVQTIPRNLLSNDNFLCLRRRNPASGPEKASRILLLLPQFLEADALGGLCVYRMPVKLVTV
jgi:hypothetical protein